MHEQLRQEYQEKFQKALLAIRKLKAELAKAQGASKEPIAIIGMGCRFPGGVSSPEEYWKLLAEGKNAVGEIDRWDLNKLYDEDYTTPGKIATKKAALLKKIDQFDNSFFNISPIEAKYTDPQQRMLLQVACEALEHAGQDVNKVEGSNTGVFVGIAGLDYKSRFREKENFEDISAYTVTGGEMYSAAGRISYALGLEGPSIVSNTACSSSLVALHLACQSLRTGETNMAISGGANLIVSPEMFIGLSNSNALSPEGVCRTFDADANGYVRAEAVGAIVLKRLSDAIRDNDPILAVINSTAVNQDGLSNGYTAPSGKAQEKMLRTALENAGLTAADIDLIEAHGTGTPLGDPIELGALDAVLSEGHSEENPLYIGSVKTNIGHAEGASGIAGVMKLVMALQNKQIPPHLHFKTPNPYFDWEGVPFKVPTQLTEWKANGKTRTAGVSGFGISGTNAHAVISEYIQDEEPQMPVLSRKVNVLALSGKSEGAVKDYAKKYIALLKAEKEVALEQICAQAAHRKSHFDHRLTVAAASVEEMITELQTIAAEDQPLHIKPVPERDEQKVAFVFPGQGSQWIGMGRQLYQQEEVFRKKIDACEQAFKAYTDWSLTGELNKPEAESRMNEIDLIQPMLFAIEVALCELWKSWGIVPDAVIGHSMGEVAAAHAAGILSLEDAANIICSRSQLMKTVSGKGAMAVVELNRADAQKMIVGLEDRITVAVSNSEQSTVLAGDPEVVQQIVDQLDAQDLFARMIKVDVASHSVHMEPLKAPLLEKIRNVNPQSGEVAIYSTVQARSMNGTEMDADYWLSNLREAVLFGPTIEKLLENGITHFVEMSPHPVLKMAIEQTAQKQAQDVTVVASFHKNSQELPDMLRQWGALYASGFPVNWNAFYMEPVKFVSLPTYPWQEKSFWIEASYDKNVSNSAAVQKKEAPKSETGASAFKSKLQQSKDEARYEQLANYIRQQISNFSGYPLAQITETADMKRMGLDSMMIMRFRKGLEKELGFKLTTKQFWKSGNVEALCHHILGELFAENVEKAESTVEEGDWLIKTAPNPDAKLKLFAFHDAAGNAALYSKWPEYIAQNIEVIAVELPGRASRSDEALFTDMKALVQTLLPHIEKECDRPFALFGHSMGGMIAYNVALALEAKGLKAEKLFISACQCPKDYKMERDWANLSEKELVSFFPALSKDNIEEEELRQSLIRTLRADLQVVQSYQYQDEKPLDTPIVGLHASFDHIVTKAHMEKWGELTSNTYSGFKCPGGHGYLYQEIEFSTILVNHELNEKKEKLVKA